MADKVQKRLEDFVPDLRELLTHGLFTQKEIKNVIENRRKFEFEILSPDPDTSLLSYKDYLKFEMDLDKMVQSRLKKIKTNKLNDRIYTLNNFNNSQINRFNGKDIKNKDNKLKIYKLKINNKRYIHNIFRRCLNRFVNNVEVYKMYLSYCTKIKANKLFERVIIDGLSKNPNNESMWLILSSFLLNNKGLIRSKNVVQRALRILPDSLDLILYLFKLEVKSLLMVYSSINDTTTTRRRNDDSTSQPNNNNNPNGNHVNNEVIDSLNRCLVIFKYGVENIKNNKDLIVFYFSVLNILFKLRNDIVFDKDSNDNGFNDIGRNSDYLSSEINKLLDSVNSMMKDKNIPIITLYNHQIQLMERILIKSIDKSTKSIFSIDSTNSSDCNLNDSKDDQLKLDSDCKIDSELGLDLEMELESEFDFINKISCCYDKNKKQNKSTNSYNVDNKDLLVLYLQFLHNMIDDKNNYKRNKNSSNDLQLDSSKDELEDKSNDYLNDLEKEYIVSKYCILENVYYLCLLGRIPDSLNKCSSTGYLTNIEHLNYLQKLFNKYYNDLLFKNNNLFNSLLNINIGNDTYGIYYLLKLFVLLSKKINISDGNVFKNHDYSNTNLNNNNCNYINYSTLILNKIKELVDQLTQLKNINNIELIYLILKLNIDFDLKLKIFKNFNLNKTSKFNMDCLFDCGFTESEIIQLFLLLFKLDNNCDFDLFLNKFINNYNSNLNNLMDDILIVPNIDNLFFNNFMKYILTHIDDHLNNLDNMVMTNNTITNANANTYSNININLNNTQFSTIFNSIDDLTNSFNNIVDLSKLNKLLTTNTLDINNKSLIDYLNTKLNLFGLNINSN